MRTLFFMFFYCFISGQGVYSQSSKITISINGRSGGNLPLSELVQFTGFTAAPAGAVIKGFGLTISAGDDFQEFAGTSAQLTDEMKAALGTVKPGSEISFDSFIILLEGKTVKLFEGIVFTVTE